MLNVYKYYDDAKTLPKYKELNNVLPLLKKRSLWNPENAKKLEPIKHIIMQNQGNAYEYARFVLKERWPEAEPIIMKNPDYAYRYARDVINGRWEEAEPYIMKDPTYAYCYARDVIKGRWEEAEPYIKKDPQYAHWYAKNIIG